MKVPFVLTACAVSATVVAVAWLSSHPIGVSVSQAAATEEKASAPLDLPASDHVMFGGTPSRNFVNLDATGFNHQFPVDPEAPKVRVLGDRIRWKAALGSRAYGGPTVAGGCVFVGTNNENPRNNRDRGKPTDDDPLGHPVDKGGEFGGRGQIVFPGGDGWLYGFEPATGKLVWKFDANPKGTKYELGGKGTKSDFIGTPVVYKNRIFIGTGQDPEHFDGVGHFWCIDPAGKTGDISPDLVIDASKDPPVMKANPNSGVVWHFGGLDTRPYAKRDILFGRTMSTACIVDDVVYIADVAGYVDCLDANTGIRYWQVDTRASIWASCYYVDGRVLLANEDGDLYIFRHEKRPKVLDATEAGSRAAVAAESKARADGLDDTDIRRAVRQAYHAAASAVKAEIASRYLLQKVEIGECIRSTPVVVHDTLYIMSERSLFAVNLR